MVQNEANYAEKMWKSWFLTNFSILRAWYCLMMQTLICLMVLDHFTIKNFLVQWQLLKIRHIMPRNFQNFDFWPFYGPFKGIFWRFSGIFCPWTSYRSHILTQEQFFLKIWSLEMYQEILYEIVIFDHILGEGAGTCIWTFMAGDFCGRSGLPQLGVVLVL